MMEVEITVHYGKGYSPRFPIKVASKPESERLARTVFEVLTQHDLPITGVTIREGGLHGQHRAHIAAA